MWSGFQMCHTMLAFQVTVYIQLYRPSDNACSESVEFRYKPATNITNHGSRKRARPESACSPFDIPSVVPDHSISFNRGKPEEHISSELDPQKILHELVMSSVADSTTSTNDLNNILLESIRLTTEGANGVVAGLSID